MPSRWSRAPVWPTLRFSPAPPKACIARANSTRRWRRTIARAQARRAGQDGKAFDLGYAAAAIEQERKHYAAAADRFRRVAIASPKLPKAAETHLLAAYDLGQEARTAEAGVLDRYVSLLEEHLATWPQAATADRAHLWVARVRERQQDFRRAIEQYSAVRPGTESSAEAIDGLARSYLALLADLRASGKATSTSAAAAVAALEAASEIPKDDVKWTAAQSSAVLAAARILLDYTENGFAKAEQLLSRARRGDRRAGRLEVVGRGATRLRHRRARAQRRRTAAGRIARERRTAGTRKSYRKHRAIVPVGPARIEGASRRARIASSGADERTKAKSIGG